MTEKLYRAGDPEPPASVTVLEEIEDCYYKYLVRQGDGWVWNSSPTEDPDDTPSPWGEHGEDGRGGRTLRVHTETPATTFTTLDSGARATFPSGMQRDTQEGKPRYDLIPLWFLRELAELLERGASKYGDRNWEKADSPEEIARMDASGLRHHFQYLEGDKTENHLAATVFNLFAAEQTRRKVGGAE